MKTRLFFPALLAAACLLCACAPTDPAPSSSGPVSEASTSQSQTDTSQEETTYTEEDVQAAFNRSDAAQNATILDCVVAEDQAYELMGVVQYLTPDRPDFCMLGFVSLSGVVQSTGPQATPADDDSLTYLGDGIVSLNIFVTKTLEEQDGGTYQRMDMETYKLSYQKDGITITFKALGNDGEETELTPET